MYEKIIELGIIFLLIYTPLAFGGVTQGSVALMELVTGILMLVWLAKFISQRNDHLAHRKTVRQSSYHLRIITPSILVIMCLFLAVVLLQLVPLPAALVKLLSPATYRLYAEAAAHTDVSLPAFLPLSVSSQATEMELYRLLAYFATFLLIVNNIRSPRQIRRIVVIIVAVGLLESFYGLGEYFSGRHQIFFYKKQASFSVSGTFVNKNHFAGYMAMVIPLTFGVLFARLEERSQVSLKKLVRLFDEKYMKALLVSLLLFVMIGAELLSGSRGGAVSFACGMICLSILAHSRRLLRKWAVVVLVLVIVAVGIAVLLGYDLIVARLQTLKELESESSFQYRHTVWKDTLSLFRDFPILGSGLGTFVHIFPRYKTSLAELRFTHTENDYLQMLAETGIIGSLLVLCGGVIFFYTTLKAWKQRQSRWSIILTAGGISGMFSIVVHSSIDFNLHIPSNAFLFSVIAALSYVAAHSRRRSVR